MAGLTPDQPDSSGAGSARTQLDLVGLKCPLPALKTQAALARMRPGEVLEVAATDPLAAIDIPHAVSTGGHELLDSHRVEGIIHFRIRRGGR